ncbi:MAG: A24 family peptidase [Holosporaceae bacterium]|jgi:Flp pilus assembly protein protease CpaA|nr:A24 family peptidase [Holosporaceae bacterium]
MLPKRGSVVFIWLMFGAVLLIISVNDFLFFRIENEYTLFLLGLYLLSCAFGMSGHNFLSALQAFVAIFAISWIFNRRNLIGGGDIKLLCPLLLFSENNVPAFLLGISISGIVASLFYLFLGRQIFFLRRKMVVSLYVLNKNSHKSFFLNIVLLSLSRIDKRMVALKRCITSAMKQEIPYGIVLSCGGFCVMFERLVG